MNIKRIIKETIIREQKYHELNFNINFTFDLYHDEGGHTQARKWRHGSSEKIYDYDIIKLLNDAREEIIYGIIDGDIVHNRRFIVSREGGDYLNIIINPEKLESNHWNLVTITTMKKRDFTISKGQVQILVP